MEFCLDSNVIKSIATLSAICTKPNSKTPILSHINIQISGDSIIGLATERHLAGRVGARNVDGLRDNEEFIDFTVRAIEFATLAKTLDKRNMRITVIVDTDSGIMRIDSGFGRVTTIAIHTDSNYPPVGNLIDSALSADAEEVDRLVIKPSQIAAINKIRPASRLSVRADDMVHLVPKDNRMTVAQFFRDNYVGNEICDVIMSKIQYLG